MKDLDEADLLKKLEEILGKKRVRSVSSPRSRRINLEVEKNGLKESALILKSEGFSHLSTITAQETPGGLEVIYHIVDGGTVVNMRLILQQGDTHLPTLTDVYAGAALYEREVSELMGIEFDGHPNMGRLILPEQWPRGKHPLRKDRAGDSSQGDVSQGATANS